jgi:hypothetical protein
MAGKSRGKTEIEKAEIYEIFTSLIYVIINMPVACGSGCYSVSRIFIKLFGMF